MPNYTYTDYLNWEGQWEIIDGLAYAMSPSPSPSHHYIASNLNHLLVTQVRQSGCNCRVYHPIDVVIEENTVVNPDLLIVCHPIKEKYLDKPPTLVVEIFSPSTKLKDQITKYDLYESFGVKYYLMVDPDAKEITSYCLNSENKYDEMAELFFSLDQQCEIELDPDLIFE